MFILFFRDIRPTSLDKAQEAFRLRGYGLYAWGGPFLITAIAALLDNLPNSDMAAIRPRFGEIRCWFYGSCSLSNHLFLTSIRLTFFDRRDKPILRESEKTNPIVFRLNRRSDKSILCKMKQDFFLDIPPFLSHMEIYNPFDKLLKLIKDLIRNKHFKLLI